MAGMEKTQNNFNSLPHAEVDDTTGLQNSLKNVFQLTTSRRGRLYTKEMQTRKKKFQLTTSRRGRLIQEVLMRKIGYISTHYLTQR